eukprot:snap_masked-scaffold_8-processed-gene-4.28-mRNA-1 protein AED:1.00 eAED:1.00 QI:0/0/0/0/1/1/3/0/65
MNNFNQIYYSKIIHINFFIHCLSVIFFIHTISHTFWAIIIFSNNSLRVYRIKLNHILLFTLVQKI